MTRSRTSGPPRERAGELEREHLRAGQRRAEEEPSIVTDSSPIASRAAASERASGIACDVAASCTAFA